MPNYDEIIRLSHDNINALNQKLKELDRLYQNVRETVKQPEIFDEKYKEIVKITQDYTKTISNLSTKYIDGTNEIIAVKLKGFDESILKLDKEIAKLHNVDFQLLFKGLQNVFLEESRKAISEELSLFNEKIVSLQTEIERLKKELARLESIDFEKHFDKLQKTLSDILGAINSVSINTANISQLLTNTLQNIDKTQKLVESSHSEVKQILLDQIEKNSHHYEEINNKISNLAKQLELQNKTSQRLFLVQIFIGTILAILIITGLLV